METALKVNKIPIPKFAKHQVKAAILSAVIPGLGQIFNKQVRKGILYFIFFNLMLSASLTHSNATTFGEYAFTIIATFLLWISNIYDAFKNAERIKEV